MRPRSHANRGRWFQLLLDQACADYRERRSAYIFPVPTPIHVVRQRGGQIVQAYFERKSSPDYLGFLPSGTGLAFDAKSTVQPAWSAEVPEHQVEALDLAFRLGHIAGIMVGFGQTEFSAVWVPWPVAKGLVAGGAWTRDRTLTLPGAVAILFTGTFDFLPAVMLTPTFKSPDRPRVPEPERCPDCGAAMEHWPGAAICPNPTCPGLPSRREAAR